MQLLILIGVDTKRYVILIFILGLISALSPFSVDMYLPAFPAIAIGLHTHVSQVQLSMSSYLLGISAGQMLYGPLLDRFGRKKPLYMGMGVYILASLACAVTRSVNMLIMMGLLQALGSCAGMVAGGALVRDLFPGSDIAKVLSLLLLVVMISPMLAPTIGGYVSAALGWHYIFIILTAIAVLITLACMIWLPHGREPDTQLSLKPKNIIGNFYEVFKHPQFFTYAVTAAVVSAAQYAYLSGSSDVFIDYYHVDARHYGRIFAIIGAGLIGSSQINSLALRRFTNQQVIKVALICQSLMGLMLYAFTYYHWVNVYGTITLIFAFLCCQGFIAPNASALSLAPFAKQAGSASALMGTLQMGFGAVASAMVSLLNNGPASPRPMTGIMMVCPILALITLAASIKFYVKKRSAALAGEL